MRLRNLSLAAIVLLTCIAIFLSERNKADVAVSSDPIMHMLGDTERELTRLPVVFTRLSDEDEIQIGDNLARQYDSDWDSEKRKDPIYQDVQAYITKVGARVAAGARRKLPYKFHYIADNNFVNAFALPGGHVFIGQGLINLMDSEDELASVLGHEVEHVDLYHCAERVQLEARLKRLPLGSLVGAAIDIPYSVFAAGYSKEQELDADSNGTQLSVTAGYSPTGAVRLFEKFQQFEPANRRPADPAEEMASVALESLQEYFRSHPPAAERAARIRSLIAQSGWKATQERDLLIAYIHLSDEAGSALTHYQYDRAISLAKRALAQKPELPDTLKVLYAAQMYSGRFADASETAKHWLAQNASTTKEIADSEHAFANALGARNDHKQASADFMAWVVSAPPYATNLLVKIDAAGLAALAGNPEVLDRMTAEFTVLSKNNDQRPEGMSALTVEQVLERAGHWYYAAGNYDRAFTCFSDAQAMSLGSGEVSAWIAFSGLQLGRMYVAQDEFASAVNSFPDAQAGRVVLFWKNGDKDRAIATLGYLSADPKWKNKEWVTAFYGTAIFQGLEDVRAEQKRREEEAKKRLSER